MSFVVLTNHSWKVNLPEVLTIRFFFTLWQFLAVRPRRPRPLVPVCLSPAAVQWLLQWSLPSEQAQQPSLLDAGRESSGKSLLDGLS